MTELETAIKNVLDPLLGMQLTAATTIGNLRSFYFGELRRTAEGQLSTDFADFALRVSCTWRIEGAGVILVGSRDFWDRASDNKDPKWESGKPWGTRQNELLQMVLGGEDPDTKVIVNTTDRLVVEAIAPDRFGGVSFSLSGGYRLVIFPSSTQHIDWLLDPTGDGAGFMVRGGDSVTIPPDSKLQVGS